MRFPTGLLHIAAIALLASACGSAASAAGGSSQATPPTTSAPKIHLTSAQLVDRMILRSNDVLNFTLISTGVEKLKDQLVPANLRGAAAENKAARAGWLASEHSIIGTTNRTRILTDANLFRSSGSARRVWTAERHVDTWALHATKPPLGSPPGALYVTGVLGKYLTYEVAWRQGPVIGQAAMLFAKTTKPSPRLNAAVAVLLARASTALSGHIAATQSS